MTLPDDIRDEIVDLLMRGEDVPLEYQRFLFPPERREYELVYGGKEREADILADTMAVPLQPVRTFGSNPGTTDWRNLLIFGDNLQAMKTLLAMKKRGELKNADGSEGVRLIYIDPPFATKQDFHGSQDQKAYQDKIAGAKFLEFIRRRLIMLRDLLSDNGCIYVHLDQKKSHYIKVLMDEIFGEKAFLNHVIWSYRRWPSTSTNYQSMHDDLLFYAKNPGAKRIFNLEYEAPARPSQLRPTYARGKSPRQPERRSVLQHPPPGGYFVP
ncbi:MAG: site-specific DNA-methyltransferase [Capsulimonadales bacterium]|nr:site-specific DNA-methyltransferase [Capsulimonadales bacterium]